MLDVPSAAYFNHADGEFLDQFGTHGFPAPTGRLLTLDESCLGLVKPETIEAGGDQHSAVTNMSNITSASGEASGSSGERDAIGNGVGGTAQQPISSAATSGVLNSNGLTVVVKRKRNLPGTPDPDAEVIALSPKTLMATNRFVCEICNKGFQRDQNLQLHRRGHNLPWKLKQRSSKEIRKRVYICPEPSCVHHDPARALGDLTGIKKHFCRKHGEKKWKCDKCSKRYAVQSDWKAHSKTCGTREYRCDCGTLFSRRDSFITHRAFCDALAEESARVNTGVGHLGGSASNAAMAGLMMGGLHSPSRSTLSRLGAGSSTGMDASRSGLIGGGANTMFDNNSLMSSSSRPRLSLWLGSGPGTGNDQQNIMSNDHFSVDPFGSGSSLFADNFEGPKPLSAQYGNLLGHVSDFAGLSALAELSGFSGQAPSLSSMHAGNATSSSGLAGLPSVSSLLSQAHASSAAQTSATALLQKAAQMGATASNPSLLKNFGTSLMPAQNIPASWPPTSILGGSHQGFFPSLPVHNPSSSGFLHHKAAGLDDLRSTLSAISNNNEALKSSNSFMDAAGATSIQELISSMSPPASLYSGSTGMQRNTSASHLFGMNSENRNPNSLSSPLTAARDTPFNVSSHGQHQQQQAKLALMGFGSNTPKSEDGITRDFLGVRGVSTLIGAQDHGTAAPLVKSLPQRDISSNLYPLGMDQYSSSPRDSLRSLNGINAQSSPGRSWADNA